jgi:site-specific DNA-methyltransferase (adenine-specific)
MKPYYEHAGITIYHGDAREAISEVGEPQSLIVDPVWPNCPDGLLQGSKDPFGLWAEFWDVMPHPIRAAVVLRHDCDPRFLSCVPLEFARTVILPYVIPGYIGRYLGGDELAYCFGEPIERKPGQILIPGRAPLCQPDGRRANGHPCSRPLSHTRFLVKWWSQPDEVILDPFCGSGTTLVAAKELGRKAIGIEIEECFCEIAAKRLSQEVLSFPAEDRTVSL